MVPIHFFAFSIITAVCARMMGSSMPRPSASLKYSAKPPSFSVRSAM